MTIQVILTILLGLLPAPACSGDGELRCVCTDTNGVSWTQSCGDVGCGECCLAHGGTFEKVVYLPKEKPQSPL